MIDDALLRPGRLEVPIEIGLPKESGRLQVGWSVFYVQGDQRVVRKR